ncbi:28983_t:CDS:2, partial [Gigaspora margarita]
DYYLRGGEKSHGHYETTCYYCIPKKSWVRGKPTKLEAYLANECPNSLPNQTTITSHFLSDRLLPKANLIKKIIKAWVMAGIPYKVIKNLFIKDMFKEFLPVYNPLSKTTLSGRLLDEKIARVNCAIDRDIDKAVHLTLANEISTVIEKLGSDKFVAVVTDAASNCNLARQEMYPHIWNLLSEQNEAIMNQEIANLMANGRLVRSVWQPIKEVIYALETNEATLADCFAYLIKLAGLKDNGFHRAALLSLELWQNLGHTRPEGEELIAQMRRFDARSSPFDLPYVSGIDTPKIWWGLLEANLGI